MNCLITGGMGFIGSHLTEALLMEGHQVQSIDNLSTGSMVNTERFRSLPSYKFAIETIHNESVMDRLISECDVIYHLAAAVGVKLIISNPVEVIETNILGTEVVLKIARRYRKKLFIASTSEIYGKNDNVPFTEEDSCHYGATTNWRWCYACSKAIDEFLSLAYYEQYDFPIVIGRLFNTVGPRQTGQYGMVIPRFIRQAMKGEEITVYGDGEQTRCFGYVVDVVKAIIRLMETEQAAHGQIFNIGSTEEISINNLAQIIKKRLNSKSPIVHIPYEKAYAEGFEDMRRRVPDMSKLKSVIEFVPETNLQTIIDRILEYSSQNPNY